MTTNGARGVPEASGSPRQKEQSTAAAYTTDQLVESLRFFGERFTEYASQFDGQEVQRDLAEATTTVEIISQRLTEDETIITSHDQEYNDACASAEAWHAETAHYKAEAQRQGEEASRLRFLLTEKEEAQARLETERAHLEGVVSTLRANLAAVQKDNEGLKEENKALRAWKDGKLKTDTTRRSSIEGQQAQIDRLTADLDAARRELEAAKQHVAAGKEAQARLNAETQRLTGELKVAREQSEERGKTLRLAKDAHGQETLRLSRELAIARDEATVLKAKAEALKQAEESLKRQTQAFLSKRALNAIERGEKPKIIALTTSTIHASIVGDGKDPILVIQGTDLGQLLDLAESGLKFTPPKELIALVQRYNGGIEATHAASQLRTFLDDAKLTLHKIGLHIEESARQIEQILKAKNAVEAKLRETTATLQQREEALRAAVLTLDEVEGTLERQRARIARLSRTTKT